MYNIALLTVVNKSHLLMKIIGFWIFFPRKVNYYIFFIFSNILLICDLMWPRKVNIYTSLERAC